MAPILSRPQYVNPLHSEIIRGQFYLLFLSFPDTETSQVVAIHSQGKYAQMDFRYVISLGNNTRSMYLRIATYDDIDGLVQENVTPVL